MPKFFLITLLVLSVAFPAFAQDKHAVLGKWLNASGEGQILVFKAGEKFFGKLIWLKEPYNEKGLPKTDIKNPDPKARTRPLLGLELLRDFIFENGKWTEGKIYDPKSGKTYSCILSLRENGQLNIRGYIGISLLGRSEDWKRVK